MTDFVKKMIQRNREAEEAKYGAIYSACEEKGCDRPFVKVFIFRAELYPLEQTSCFLHPTKYTEESEVKKWEVLLRALVEKKPTHEKVEEWKKAIAEIESFNKSKNENTDKR